jgi:hypothetical protein
MKLYQIVVEEHRGDFKVRVFSGSDLVTEASSFTLGYAMEEVGNRLELLLKL